MYIYTYIAVNIHWKQNAVRIYTYIAVKFARAYIIARGTKLYEGTKLHEDTFAQRHFAQVEFFIDFNSI